MIGGIDSERWDAVLADVRAFAREYREAGWEVLAVESGPVSPAEKDDRFGLSVLLPGGQYDELEAIVGRRDVALDDAEVYTSSRGDTVYTIVIERDESSQTAIVIPMVYAVSDLATVFERALETGRLEVHLRPLEIESWVTFAHDDPALFFDEERLEAALENDPRRMLREDLAQAKEPDDGEPADGVDGADGTTAGSDTERATDDE